ncbi:pseudouridine synthase [Vibrio methylphosphonaticus]|uniref:pseudouridine synthase n=1 Tax=Vibrio methylphosphonaticus TaxID=2946866 RepID=UPI002029FC7F|nr:pseudouridine synthase [Vibrio methylphosphonaticus]MCL9776600.1 pseudouridine synthase [Vibrio methylphosphonaticus]
MRLDRFVCKSTMLTRVQASSAIERGEVCVNGQTMTSERAQVHENNLVTLNGVALSCRPFRYLLLNKTAGTICSNIDEVYPSLFNNIDIEHRDELHIAGRLDADTTGLVLITDDGRWSFNIITPSKQCRKVYRVGLSKAIDLDAADKFKQGIQLQGEEKLTKPALLEMITPKDVRLTITEGKFHQVKRMFASIGNKVVTLHRERIGDIQLDVMPGEWRYLTQLEIESFSDKDL